jgi:hypothetical protein
VLAAFTDLMMEAASTSETLVNFYQTTRHNNPEASHLKTIAVHTELQLEWKHDINFFLLILSS